MKIHAGRTGLVHVKCELASFMSSVLRYSCCLSSRHTATPSTTLAQTSAMYLSTVNCRTGPEWSLLELLFVDKDFGDVVKWVDAVQRSIKSEVWGNKHAFGGRKV
jgi:hypothetical protein